MGVIFATYLDVVEMLWKEINKAYPGQGSRDAQRW
jgi:hypothetical protein